MLATGLPGASAIASDDIFAELSPEFSLLDADGACAAALALEMPGRPVRLQRETQWQNRPPPGTGSGWGLAFARFKNLSSYLGIVMQLQVDAPSKAIQLIKATAVCDAGLVINPDGLKAQIEGGIIQSSSWTLKEQVPLSNAAREARDWKKVTAIAVYRRSI